MPRHDTLPRAWRPAVWGWVVTVSACLIVGGMIALGVAWAATSERRVATYAVHGSLARISLDLGAGSAVVVGGGDRVTVAVRRSERFAFGRRPLVTRTTSDGALRIRTRCPATVIGDCKVAYRLIVPDNVAVSVRTTSGDVRLEGIRGAATVDTTSGSVDVARYCGFSLRAHSGTGDLSARASCAPQRLDLRSRTGDVHAVVPAGRYEIDATTNAGDARVSGLTDAIDAPFGIEASSATGEVTVEASG